MHPTLPTNNDTDIWNWRGISNVEYYIIIPYLAFTVLDILIYQLYGKIAGIWDGKGMGLLFNWRRRGLMFVRFFWSSSGAFGSLYMTDGRL